jgi:phosphatidylglycerophosphate synthase
VDLADLPYSGDCLLVLALGTYWSFVWGLILFQVFSVLDGCDGEIARAKFRESERGRQLDDLFDVLSNILLVLGLSVGLSRPGWFYGIEGIAAAILIAINEWYLASRATASAVETPSDSLSGAIYPRHRKLSSGLSVFGEQFASFVMQLTKRDVAVLFFVFLAVIGLPALILHLLLVVTAVSLVCVESRVCRFAVRSVRAASLLPPPTGRRHRRRLASRSARASMSGYRRPHQALPISIARAFPSSAINRTPSARAQSSFRNTRRSVGLFPGKGNARIDRVVIRQVLSNRDEAVAISSTFMASSRSKIELIFRSIARFRRVDRFRQEPIQDGRLEKVVAHREKNGARTFLPRSGRDAILLCQLGFEIG